MFWISLLTAEPELATAPTCDSQGFYIGACNLQLTFCNRQEWNRISTSLKYFLTQFLFDGEETMYDVDSASWSWLELAIAGVQMSPRRKLWVGKPLWSTFLNPIQHWSNIYKKWTYKVKVCIKYSSFWCTPETSYNVDIWTNSKLLYWMWSILYLQGASYMYSSTAPVTCTCMWHVVGQQPM